MSTVATVIPTQQTHDVIMTSYQRRCDVMTSHRRRSDVMCLLGTQKTNLRLNDGGTEDDEQYRADVYGRDTVIDVTITKKTLTADNDCSGDTTLTTEETCFRR